MSRPACPGATARAALAWLATTVLLALTLASGAVRGSPEPGFVPGFVQLHEVDHARPFSLLTPEQLARSPVPPVVTDWGRVGLPLWSYVPRAQRTAPPWARSQAAVLRIAVPPELDQGDLALYVPRLDGLPHTTVFLDGRNLLAAIDQPSSRHFNRPFLVLLPPPDPGRTAARELLLVRVGPPSFGHRMSTVWLAPREQAVAWQRTRTWVQAEGPRLVSGGLLLLGVFSLFVWLRRRADTAFLWFFVLTLLFFVRCWHYHSDYPATVPLEWAHWMNVQSLNGISVCALLFARALHSAGGLHRRLENAVVVLAVAVAAVFMPPVAELLPALAPQLAAQAYTPGALLCVGVALLLAHAAWRERSGVLAALAVVLTFNLGLGLHDLAMLAGVVAFDRVFLLPFGGLAMFVTFLWAIARQHGQALHQADEARRSLQSRLAGREAELRASLETLQHEREQRVLADERQRLMREMHDGLGSALASSLVAVQRGQATPELLRGMLGDAVDELRLTIDSLEPSGGDLLLLLATARWRLEPRLQAAGVALHWHVGELPPLPWLTAQHALHLLRILQELLANVVRHAQAQHVTIATAALGDVIEVSIGDDGRGFDLATAPAGRGRANVARRAAALGATLHWHSAPGRGTRVTLRLPVQAPVPLPAGAGLPAPESKPS